MKTWRRSSVKADVKLSKRISKTRLQAAVDLNNSNKLVKELLTRSDHSSFSLVSAIILRVSDTATSTLKWSRINTVTDEHIKRLHKLIGSTLAIHAAGLL